MEIAFERYLETVKNGEEPFYNESSLTRVKKWMTTYPSGIVTAFRDLNPEIEDWLDGWIKGFKNTKAFQEFTDKFPKADLSSILATGLKPFYEKNTKDKKMNNNASLRSKLLALGYSVTPINGVFIENQGTATEKKVKEKSFFVTLNPKVVFGEMDKLREKIKGAGDGAEKLKAELAKLEDKKDKMVEEAGKKLREDLINLGTAYSQDAVIFGTPQDGFELIGTSRKENKDPAYGQSFSIGKSFIGKSGIMHSTVNNRPFIFESVEPETVIGNFRTDEIKTILMLSQALPE